MKLSTFCIGLMFASACTAQVDSYFEEVPPEPALTSDEVAALPDGTEVEHTTDLEADLAALPPVDDASAYDSDDVEPMVDVEVTDTDGDAPAAYAALLKWGLHPRASDALRAARVSSGRIMQTIGNAAASAGTHARDGYVNGQPYSAATDISVYGLSQSQIRNLLEKLAKVGFAAWYRHNGYDGWYGVNHIHAVYANCKMKASLRSQVRSWLAGRNGLASNTIAERMGLHQVTAQAQHNLGLVLARLGRLDEAREVETAAMRALDAQGNRRLALTARNYLALIEIDAGNFEKAIEHVTEAIETGGDMQTAISPYYATASLACRLSGDAAGALAHARRALELIAIHGQPEEGEASIRLAHAHALYATGAQAEARAAMLEAEAQLREKAAKIEDERWCACFLEAVPENAETIRLARAWR